MTQIIGNTKLKFVKLLCQETFSYTKNEPSYFRIVFHNVLFKAGAIQDMTDPNVANLPSDNCNRHSFNRKHSPQNM